MADLFISYAHEDKERIGPLAKAFEKQGWTVFWDRRIPAGKTWHSYIGEALEDARCVIVTWSVHSIVSEWVFAEAEKSRKREILVPVFLDSVEPPMPFGTLQTADLTNWQPEHPSTEFKLLVQDINAILKGTPKRQVPLIDIEPEKPKPQQDKPIKDLRVRLAMLFVIGVIAAILGWYLYISEDPFLRYYYIAVIIFCPAFWLIMKNCSGKVQIKAVILLFVLSAFFAILAVSWRYFEVTTYLNRQEKSLRPPVGFKLGPDGLETAYEPYYIPYFLLLGTCLLITFATIFYFTSDEESIENRIPITGWFLGFSMVIGLSRLAWQIIDSLG